MVARLLAWLRREFPWAGMWDTPLPGDEDDGLTGTCPIHDRPVVWEPGGDDMPTVFGRLRCDGCDTAFARLMDGQ
jgi:hypothetical protein